MFIGDNEIGDKGAKEIGLALQKNHTLTKLNLGSLMLTLTAHRRE